MVSHLENQYNHLWIVASQMVKLLWEVELCQYESTIFHGSRKYKDEKHKIFSYFTYEELHCQLQQCFYLNCLQRFQGNLEHHLWEIMSLWKFWN